MVLEYDFDEQCGIKLKNFCQVDDHRDGGVGNPLVTVIVGAPFKGSVVAAGDPDKVGDLLLGLVHSCPLG